ncbi:MAG: hypothetical protein AAFV77_00720 [Planctomycetota bacterium]
MAVTECPRCRYPVEGLPGLTCPECGYERPPPPTLDPRPRIVQLREVARVKMLRCRHCKTPLELLQDDGRCAGCGVVYDFPDARPDRDPDEALITHNARRVSGVVVVGVFVALGLLLALLYVVLIP